MGLLDNFKKIIANTASDAIGNAINQVKEEAVQTIKEEVKEEIKEKTENAVAGGIKSYINNAKEKAPTEEAKEAIDTFGNLISDSYKANKQAAGIEKYEEDYMQKTTEGLVKLGEYADKYNETQNNQNNQNQ